MFSAEDRERVRELLIEKARSDSASSPLPPLGAPPPKEIAGPTLTSPSVSWTG